MTHDYYNILGVSKNADSDQIKQAYKTLAKKYHPDLNRESGAEEKFKEVSEAYTVLSDPQKRSNYDQYGSAEAFSQGTGFDFSQFFKSGQFTTDFADLFSDMGFGGGFDNFFSRQKEHLEPVDLRMDVELSLQEAFSGVEKTLKLDVESACTKCDGKGYEKASDIESCSACKGRGVIDKIQKLPFGSFSVRATCGACGGSGQRLKNACSKCKGIGKEIKTKNVTVKIPAGIDSGNHLRLKNQGAFSKGRQGDLYLVIHVKQHGVFQRDGKDLFMKLPITFSEAALGASIDFAHLDGEKIELAIPAGTQTDEVFRVKGKGMPIMDSKTSGDLFAEVKVKTPTNLTAKQKEALQSLASDEKHNRKKGLFDRIKETFGD